MVCGQGYSKKKISLSSHLELPVSGRNLETVRAVIKPVCKACIHIRLIVLHFVFKI